MKHTILVITLICFSTLTAQNPVNDWENPAVNGINKEQPHAYGFLAETKANNPTIISLNGTWHFKWSPDPQSRPVDFYRENYSLDDAWSSILVPGNWEMQGFGTPIYSNISYPFKVDPPRVMGEPRQNFTSYKARNPVGSYCRTFQLPENWKDKQVFINFGGVQSAMYLWINGQKVGYSENSMSPAEFDISQFIRPGENKLAVEVYRWCDGSYLEDQDIWRLSGIFRDVDLIARPKTYIRDFFVTATPTAAFDKASVGINISVENRSGQQVSGLKVEAEITGFNKQGGLVEQVVSKSVLSIMQGKQAIIDVASMLHQPRLWSAETPDLYHLTLRLKNKKNELIEKAECFFGVRSIEVRGEVFYVNGKPVKLKGVNRHEQHPRTGRHVSRSTMIRDLELMKQANINFIRTCHYPDDPLFYELCDTYGFYVMDEANQESHGLGIGNKTLGDNPVWKQSHVERAVSLVQRDKNHACVFFWSLGNEGGKGQNMVAMADTIKKLDTSRLIFSDTHREVSDLYDDSYLHPADFKKLGERITDKPVMMREYLHVMGNSGGNLQEYWDVIYDDLSIAGAAVWEWVDQGLAKPKDGSPLSYGKNPDQLHLNDTEFWAFGGDFGDMPNDGNFSIKGLVASDRTPHPHYYEVQKVYQPILFKQISGTRINVTNRFDFLSLGQFDVSYEYTINGKPVKTGKLMCDIQPSSSAEMVVPALPANQDVSSEVCLNLYVKLKSATLWAAEGFCIAREQVVLKPFDGQPIKSDENAVNINQTSTQVVLSAGTSTFIFDMANGALSSWKVKGKELLKGQLEPYFWKTPNDNQKQSGFVRDMSKWKTAGEKRVVNKMEVSNQNQLTTLRFDMSLPSIGADYVLQYRLNGKGQLQVDASYTPHGDTIPLLPKFGMRMRIPKEFATIDWYGRGPWENYPDRKTGSLIGVYESTLENFVVAYTAPQDNANRCDTRWFSLGSQENNRIKITGLQPLNFRAWPYSEEDLEKTSHDYLLPRRDFINLNIDLNIHGVGGDDTWGAKTLAKYTNPGNKPYQFGFILEYSE